MRHSILTRREFVTGTGTAAFGAMVLPRHVLGGPGYRAPSDTLNFAVVGMGQQGTENAESLIAGGERLIAVCDVDFSFTERQVDSKKKDREGKERPEGIALNEQFSKVKRYTDFRDMLERQPDLDAVLIATPDHLHAAIAKTAMELGKHVYCQKPLTWSVQEARLLKAVARSTGVVTQMGNQGHSSDDARRVNEWIQAGVIGPVREVHVWTNRPIWPQGIPRPAPLPPVEPDARPSWNSRAINNRLAAAMIGDYDPPDDMRWDLYLGPVPEDIPWHPVYHPFNWRGWTAFGVGALGDMGAHLVDHPYWALDLGYPSTIEATSTPWGGPREAPVSYPLAMTVHYLFPARGILPPVVLHWYDGGFMPPRPSLLPEEIELLPEGGVIYVGEWGVLMHQTYGREPQLFPESLRERAEAVPQTYERVGTNHLVNFALACKGLTRATSPFDYAAPLTEVMLLGIVALRTGQGRTIHYDGEAMEITNVPEANQYLTRPYREGWAL
ncbi:MAG: Gfo/Idh/MocA family oxidoreductase [Longimicrobiales bacterium]